MYPLGQCQFWREGRLQFGIVFNLAANITHHPAKLRSQSRQRPIGTLELLGMRLTRVADQRALADALVGLRKPTPKRKRWASP